MYFLNAFFFLTFHLVYGTNMSVVFSWKQLSYNFDGINYAKSSDYERTGFDNVHFADELEEPEKFFIQYNNVPIGLEKDGDRVFVTVPRRQHGNPQRSNGPIQYPHHESQFTVLAVESNAVPHRIVYKERRSTSEYGIPSTLNYVTLSDPVLRPYPDAVACKSLISVYRPRIDECGRLWMVDTGLLEVPGARKQVQPPAIVVYDLTTNHLVLKHEIKSSVLVNNRTSAGLTSITIDVDPNACDDAYAYINDLATNGMIVFSLRDKDSWRLEHDRFKLEERAANFSVAEHIINWKDGLFSIALTGRDASGRRKAFFHPLVSTQEFSVDTEHLKNRDIGNHVKLLGTRGLRTQSGSHDYHGSTNTLFFANVAQDGILCWKVDTPMTKDSVQLVAQDHEKLVYISDLKVKGDEVWVLANQITRFVYSALDPRRSNFYVLKATVHDLIRGSICDSVA